MTEPYKALGISDAVLTFGEKVLAGLTERFAQIDAISEANQMKVIAAMQKNRLAANHFNLSSGYGYDDEGRDNLERVYADCFGTEAALVRPQITCGTHALTVALSANLLPGDELLSPVGGPYDTLEEVIGIRPSAGSLKEYGVSYRQVDLLPGGAFDYDGIRAAINEKTKLVTIQRSKGYATRPSFSVEQIGQLIAFCKQCKPDVICMVDNCYGEFTLSNGDTMKLWKLNGAYEDLSAEPMKGMVEEFPIEAEENTVYVADVTSNGETTRQYLRADKAGRNGTASVKTFELGDAE